MLTLHLLALVLRSHCVDFAGDPQYHRVGDVVDRPEYSILQATLAARVTLAAAADLANLN